MPSDFIEKPPITPSQKRRALIVAVLGAVVGALAISYTPKLLRGRSPRQVLAILVGIQVLLAAITALFGGLALRWGLRRRNRIVIAAGALLLVAGAYLAFLAVRFWRTFSRVL